MRAWIGIALLSVSWLLGLSYYHQGNWLDESASFVYTGAVNWLICLPAALSGSDGLLQLGSRLLEFGACFEANWLAWGVAVAAGTALLSGTIRRLPSRGESALALGLALPALILAPWPYRAAVLLLAAGLALNVLPYLRRCSAAVRAAPLVAGGALLAQALAMLAYAAVTSRSHELPQPLAHLLGAAAGLLGIDVAVYETTITTHSMREQHFLGATWELFLDPVTCCFVAGGLVLVCWSYWADSSPEKRTRHLLRSLGLLLAIVALWLPLRAGLLMAVFLNDVLRTDYEAPLDAVKLFWSTGLHLALLAVPVLAAWRFLPVRPSGPSEPHPPHAKRASGAKWQRPLAAGLVFAGVALLSVAVFWDPVGRRMEGRVLVEEYHQDPEKIWEPTFKPFDTEWYGHLSGYNYYCIYEYLSHYYDMSRLRKPIDDRALDQYDVLVIKVPTREYADDEIEAVVRFVERGGGLLLIGEHTNVFGTGTHLNRIARRFGFSFRYDCLFGIDSVFAQHYQPPLVPHPIVQHMPPLDFATSCSLDPGKSSGRAVIRDAGLKSLMADYHVDNFYPAPDDRADMRYGAFVQLWSTRYGRGRVAAFTDSTIFSNFATFEPGKPELMLGMVEWLNHRSRLADPRWPLASVGLIVLLGGLAAAILWDVSWPLLLGAGLLAWSAAVTGVQAAHRWNMPRPQPVQPMVQVVMDQTVSGVQLPRNGFIAGKEGQFGIFERWILRLGYFTSRRKGADVFRDRPDLVVILYPNKRVSKRFQRDLVDYVAGGGKLLVVDSPDNLTSSANSLLQPFDLAIDRSAKVGGELTASDGSPGVPIDAAYVVEGGEPFAHLDGNPVGTHVRHGKGLVTAIGFGSRFSDANMGVTGDVVPDEDLAKIFELEYSMLRAIVEQQ